MYKKCIFGGLQFLMILYFLVLQCTNNAPKWHQNGAHWKEFTERIILMYKKCIFDALQFLMILHFLVLQCTTNGANSPSNPLISNLHAIRSILNPILNSFKSLDFWLILADFPLTVLKYSTFSQKSVFIFGIFMVELVCMRSFSKILRWAAKSPCVTSCRRGWTHQCTFVPSGLKSSLESFRRQPVATNMCFLYSLKKKSSFQYRLEYDSE